MTATVKQLHDDTAKLLQPVIEQGQTLIIVEDGVPRVKIVPVSGESGEQIRTSIVEKDGIAYLRRGKPITYGEVAGLLAEFP